VFLTFVCASSNIDSRRVGDAKISFKSMVLPETQGNKGMEIQWPSLGHPGYMSRTVLKVHRQVLKYRQTGYKTLKHMKFDLKLIATKIIPLHHIRPKLLRPLDFPRKTKKNI
jgi:hypothetical protein